MNTIKTRLGLIYKKLAQYPHAKLVVVSKYRDLNEINEVINSGFPIIIAENRIQEAEKKFSQLPSSTKKHLIGHLQSNKAKKAVQLFDMIESVDSFKLAEKLNYECEKINKKMPILLQVNISNDTAKYGFTETEIISMYKKIIQLPYLEVHGLMTIPKYSKDPEKSRKYFHQLRQLFKKIEQEKIFNQNFKELSMGMSSDWKIALKEGATIIRVGSYIFEE